MELKLQSISIGHFTRREGGRDRQDYTIYGVSEEGKLYAFHRPGQKWEECIMTIRQED